MIIPPIRVILTCFSLGCLGTPIGRSYGLIEYL